MSPKTSEYLSEVINVIPKWLANADDVINIRYAYVIPKTIKAVLNETLEFSRCIFSGP